MNQTPLVSICCITYNHVNYLRDAIEGFLMQETSFPFEIIIHDDASTDGTSEIIQEYSNKYPELFVTILQKENQWSKGGGSIYVRFVYPRAKGKYIALCEGDDYWTDPLKLQKQVDFLEANEEYIVCVGGYEINEVDAGIKKNVLRTINTGDFNNGYSFSLTDTTRSWITQPLTALFKNDVEILNKLGQYKYSRDIHLFYHLLKKGKGFYFAQIFGVYNRHLGGIFSSQKNSFDNYLHHYRIYKELFQKNNDEYSRIMFYNSIKALLIRIVSSKEVKDFGLNKIFIFKDGITTSSSIKETLGLLITLIPLRIKKIIRNLH